MQLQFSSDEAYDRMQAVIEEVWAAGQLTTAVEDIEGYIKGNVDEIDKKRVGIKLRLKSIEYSILFIGFGPEKRLMTTPKEHVDNAVSTMISIDGFNPLTVKQALQLAGDWFAGDEQHVMACISREETKIQANLNKLKSQGNRQSEWSSRSLVL